MGKNTDYKNVYAKHYNIKIPKGFEIHHIDFNRKNNNIDNLLLLPKYLHRDYHNTIQRINACCVMNIKKGIGTLDLLVGSPSCMYYSETYNKEFENLMHILCLCDGWYKYKMYLDGKYFDVFSFDLSKDHFDISNGFTMYNGQVKYDI